MKGAVTSELFALLCFLDVDRLAYRELGRTYQLLDDIEDVAVDTRAGITTYASKIMASYDASDAYAVVCKILRAHFDVVSGVSNKHHPIAQKIKRGYIKDMMLKLYQKEGFEINV